MLRSPSPARAARCPHLHMLPNCRRSAWCDRRGLVSKASAIKLRQPLYERPLSRPSARVVVVLVRLLFDELNEVAACVVKDGHDSGADVGRRLRKYHAVAGQPGVLGLDVVDGELSDGDAVFDKSIPICAVLLGSGWAEKAHVLFAGDEVPRGEVGDQVAFQADGVVEVELLETLRAGTGQSRSSPRRPARLGRRPRVAGRPPGIPRASLRARSARPGRRFSQAGRLSTSESEDWRCSTSVSAVGRTRGEPLLSQRLRGPHMGRVSDRLVPAQAIDGSATRSPHTRPGPGPGLVGTSTRHPTTLGCTE
jgi:hypothetical protein